MKPITICIFLLLLLLTGCGSDSKTGKQYGASEDKSETFHVYVDLILNKDDNLCLYYTTDGSSNFSQTKATWEKVKGKPNKQQVVFSLPQKLKPTQLRIDLGNNSQDIYLKKITLSYRGKTVELPGTIIFSYFMPDITKTDANATTGLIRGRIKDGVRQSPSLYPKEGPLADELEKLLKP